MKAIDQTHWYTLAKRFRSNCMAKGWASEDAAQEEIDSTVSDAVQRARSALPEGESLTNCEDCEVPIPEGRRRAMPGVRLCVSCQEEADQARGAHSIYNRRGSKDSQLR
ncbi:hypothetical protein SPICUR_05450 [Spiribacter curvatus]|uniref:Zinc finger DksA/TraR C4-type domain-containing protein n=2 Tax=Spiribacter curvatus TaxID=1335757 RepID=U5T136_9GAMM|nr:hypothetical protein SPICUR_05450 [Spiribacter curvatus]